MYIEQQGRALEKFLGEECFVLGNEEGTSHFDNIEAFSEMDEIQAALDKLNVIEEESKMILYGTLMEATILPSDLHGKDAYIIVVDQYEDYGIIASVTTGKVEDLAKTIEDFITPSPTDQLQPDIEDIFVLYGQEITVVGRIRADDIDEEVSDTCNKITAEVESMRVYLEKN